MGKVSRIERITRTMTLYIKLFFTTFIITGCMETPEIPTSQESLSREKILQNKTEAKKAQEEYLKLQRQRR